ncbi:hypothetical protein BTA51_05185 [Hahella sp. CCB-MM4]|uniref:hypothetical protein n=1 Tax=Hahella sp. (strain CCB-MM4) TaxID=1926491 RepID=UPI000B9A584F|nr:hypothetical protein [Hahella sp. CCB-MM4]OZG74404.1 hypothetical protein BTA51_05185 [Hahella sp. CCB-MM4]
MNHHQIQQLIEEPEQGASSDRWLFMTGRLQQAMLAISDIDVRLGVLNQLSEQLGNHGYPGFIKLLMLLSKVGDAKAKAILAETIATAVQRTDVPTGVLNAWGSSQIINGGDYSSPISASNLLRSYWGEAPQRGLGPIEYLTVWYGQKTQRPYLSNDAYEEAIASLISLFNCSNQARLLYAGKILSDVQSVSEGAYTRQTKLRLTRLGESWLENDSPEQISRDVMSI